jgi:hypothetical protein
MSDRAGVDVGKERFIKIYGESPWTAICKFCRQPVVWARTVTQNRWVLFDGDVKTLKENADFVYFPASSVHWNTCLDTRTHDSCAGQSERRQAGGGGAGT